LDYWQDEGCYYQHRLKERMNSLGQKSQVTKQSQESHKLSPSTAGLSVGADFPFDN
jgi:hypothetical protein